MLYLLVFLAVHVFGASQPQCPAQVDPTGKYYAFHGSSKEGVTAMVAGGGGAVWPSADGKFGGGFYLTFTKSKAEKYAFRARTIRSHLRNMVGQSDHTHVLVVEFTRSPIYYDNVVATWCGKHGWAHVATNFLTQHNTQIYYPVCPGQAKVDFKEFVIDKAAVTRIYELPKDTAQQLLWAGLVMASEQAFQSGIPAGSELQLAQPQPAPVLAHEESVGTVCLNTVLTGLNLESASVQAFLATVDDTQDEGYNIQGEIAHYGGSAPAAPQTGAQTAPLKNPAGNKAAAVAVGAQSPSEPLQGRPGIRTAKVAAAQTVKENDLVTPLLMGMAGTTVVLGLYLLCSRAGKADAAVHLLSDDVAEV